MRSIVFLDDICQLKYRFTSSSLRLTSPGKTFPPAFRHALNCSAMAKLFGVDVRTINEHLQNIYTTNELDRDSTIRKIRIVQKEGDRDVSRDVDFFNLDAIIAVKQLAEKEYEKYRIIQDQIYESDFDKEVKKLTSKVRSSKPKKDNK